MAERIRLDKYLLEQGLMSSRSEAQAAIEAGNVSVNGQPANKPSQKVSEIDVICAEKAHPYVSRAALKLKGALEVFAINVRGAVCLDVGCSTGGFTEVLLEAGADHVFSVDVGRDQFHARLRDDHRVSLFEQFDARKLTSDQIFRPIDILVCDASFIGLEKVLDPAIQFVKAGGQAILLFKPQFQVGPKAVGKGGIVTDTGAVEAAKGEFANWLEGIGYQIRQWAVSPIAGGDGNQEWLVWAVRAHA